MTIETIQKFNKHLQNLIQELKNIFSSLDFSYYNNINLDDSKYLHDFNVSIKPYLNNIVQGDKDIIFNNILKNIILQKDLVNEVTQRNIFKYIMVMFIQSFRYNKTKGDLNIIIKKSKDNLSLEELAFISCLKHLKNFKTTSEKSNNEFNQLNNDIMSSGIGKMAMNIAKDIDMSKFKMDNPEKMLQSLMSGNISSNQNLQNLVNSVSSKITEELSSGNIDPQNIMSDATNLLNNPLFKNMSQMSENILKQKFDVPIQPPQQQPQPQPQPQPQLPKPQPPQKLKKTQEEIKSEFIQNLQKMKQKYVKQKIQSLKK